ncbi:hypothetical protein [Actinoplanes sp. NPDC049681]|uniref:hypothetical protein n=1 Tax=Actinoplanes sp. NPDC049681 TaxID=3363905 RepID=UPI003789D396
MTRAAPVPDDLAQSTRLARSLRGWMTGVPAIVMFGRGLRLGMLAARSARASAFAGAGRASEVATSAFEAAAVDPVGATRPGEAATVDATRAPRPGEAATVDATRATRPAEAATVDATRATRPAEAATVDATYTVRPSEAGAVDATRIMPRSEAVGVDAACEGAESPSAAAATESAAGRGRRGRKVVAAGAAGVVGVLLLPLPASAAPAPCEQAERYSAQSGSQILRLTQLHAGEDADRSAAAGDTQEVHVGEAKSAMVAEASVSSAAVARMIDAAGDGPAGKLSEAVQQQAPPTNAEPERRSTGEAEVGPVSLGAGSMTTLAQWEAGMACGATVGDVTRATARLRDAGIGDSALVRVPGKVQSESTTKLERRGAAAATVASAGLQGGDLELLDGAVKVKVIKAPSLRASMSIQDGGEVRYIPAVVEVSGRGFKTERLSTAGDDMDITFDEPGGRAGTESASTGLLGKLPVVGGLLHSGDPLPLPQVPGLPEVAQPGSDAAPATEPGTRVRISLGDVRQASRGRAIAARAAALSVTITRGPSDKRPKPGYADSLALAFDMGVLEAAAVAPESAGGVSAGAAPAGGVSAGEGGGLPITGPRVDVIALSGVALLIAGAAALIFGLRGRSRS